MENDVAVLSPEKTILTFRLSGLGSRIGAHLIDALVVLLLIILVNALISNFLFRIDQGLGMGVAAVNSVFLPLLYFVLLEGLWNGQTLGKKATSLRVRMADGTPITFPAALGRNLLRPADMLPGPYFVGLLAMFTNPKAQRIGDLAANTIVCHEVRGPISYIAAPHVVGIHPLEDRVGELRGMTLAEYAALRRFADRFPELTPETQNRLLREIWAPFAERRQVPPVPSVHPIYLVEAVVMKYGRTRGLV